MLLRSLRSNNLIFPLISIQNRSFKYRQNSRSFLSNKDRVKDFIALLGPQERQYLWEELNRLQNVKKESNSDQTIAMSPSFSELRQVFLNQSLPFIGFGFLDNLIMIVAGDYIDTTIGVTLGLLPFHTISQSFKLYQLSIINRQVYQPWPPPVLEMPCPTSRASVQLFMWKRSPQRLGSSLPSYR